jgi:alpha-beta hydrolase superfamily lysophospholipase
MMATVTSADGTAIAYERSGGGPPVILVGGALNNAQSAAPLAEVLAHQMTVIRYDRRGRGASGDTAPYAVGREIEDIDALIAELAGPACLCGFSSGAALAFEAAAAGLAVARLAMFEPPYRVDDSHRLPADYLERMTELTSRGRREEAVDYFMTTAVGLPPEALRQMRRAPAWPALCALAPTVVYDGIIMGDGAPLPARRMAALTVPTLVIDSTASPAWLRNAARATAGALAAGRHLSLDGTFHQLPADVLAPALAGFFIDRTAGGQPIGHTPA